MKLYLVITKGKRQAVSNQRAGLEREVSWPCVPDVDETIFVGKDEDGSCYSINATVTSRNFYTDEVVVEACIQNCREKYDDIIADLLRDGFVVKYQHDSTQVLP